MTSSHWDCADDGIFPFSKSRNLFVLLIEEFIVEVGKKKKKSKCYLLREKKKNCCY